ncbi:uncharacterized protein LOC62_03G004292 [Vanrija pseudolonga]|uniref:Uncharacterized protein n=1 Tax=Vanrija pseudolonga TaxID=143232 RepID=A0AAF0Y5Y6_9TREE|nr:hypothetical protein LOC62_03G004292 [Vanrija pseudolonga]
MFNKKKDTTAPGRAGRAPSPAPQVMINRRRSAGSVGALGGALNNNTNIETAGPANAGGAGAQNITGRLEANPTEDDNGGGTGDNQQHPQRRSLSDWVQRNILCVRSPEDPNNASSVPTTTHNTLPPQPDAAAAAAAVASRDPAAMSRRPHPVIIPSRDVPRTILDSPSPPATGFIHTPAGVSIIRQGDFGSELGHPIVAGYFSDGLRTPRHATPETSHDGEEQPHSHSDDFRLSPEPREPESESDEDNNERGRGRFKFGRVFHRPAASNNPTPAHSLSGSSRVGSIRNAMKSLTGLTRRAPVPTSHNPVTRSRRHAATRDALERQRGPGPRRTQQTIPTPAPAPIPIVSDRRNALEVGRDGPSDLPEFHGRQRSATEPTPFAGPIRSQPVGAPFGASGASYRPRPFGTPYVAGSAITISTRSSGTSATSVQTQPPVIFPFQGATWTPPRPPTPNPAPAGPDVAGVATEAATTALRTIAIDSPRKVFQVTVSIPVVRHGVVFARWGIRGISFSFHWLRKRISPSSTPQQQQGSPELHVPATMQAPLVARGDVGSAAGASSGDRATIKDDDEGKGGNGNAGDKNAGGNKGKDNVGHGIGGNGGKSGDNQGDGGKGGGGKDNRGKGNGEKKEEDLEEEEEDEDDGDDKDEELSDGDDDEWTDINTDTEADWSDCGEPVNSFLDSSSDEEAPLLPRGRGDGRRGGRR